MAELCSTYGIGHCCQTKVRREKETPFPNTKQSVECTESSFSYTRCYLPKVRSILMTRQYGGGESEGFPKGLLTREKWSYVTYPVAYNA
ncbi:hypothetical protein NC653_035004 [Populus alba x Populus x berolinensis]|uniref:Uncharacterized protein n=1 Tax=Populus alba x Populus x berolinensis TaxID=444605 RepID=A0AAD6LQ10_9ROSI|nr:hypothetical protein NC653_035004 [Populus alba x Populus x berolinensis]